MIRAAIFDLDGTLLDTLGDLHAAVNVALAAFGLPPRTLDEVRAFVGNGVRDLMKRAIPEEEAYPRFEECLAAFRAHYSAHSTDLTCPYAGIPALLADLRRRGMRFTGSVTMYSWLQAVGIICGHGEECFLCQEHAHGL